MKKTIILCIGAIFALTAQAQNKAERPQWEMPKHEVSVSVGIPGLAMPEYHDENVIHLLDFEDFSAVGELRYFYNFNKHWAIGGSASYWHAHDGCDVYTDSYNPHFDFNPTLPIPHNDANFNVVSLMPEARAFWFQRRHFGMYSRLGLGVSFVHMNQKLDGTYKHLYIAPVFEIAPIGFDFGGKHFRGKFELGNVGQTFLANFGIGYRF